jgi:hypothetical protein
VLDARVLQDVIVPTAGITYVFPEATVGCSQSSLTLLHVFDGVVAATAPIVTDAPASGGIDASVSAAIEAESAIRLSTARAPYLAGETPET